MSMKGGRGPAFDIWSRVLQRLQNQMKQFRTEDDAFEIDPDKYNVKHDQDIFLEILAEMTSAKLLISMDLDRCSYASGLWYEFRSNHTRRCGNSPPYVLNNNWIQGNQNKIQRAKAHKHWFLSDDQTCSPWKATMAVAVESFTQDKSSLEALVPFLSANHGPWRSNFPISSDEISHLESIFARSKISLQEKIVQNGKDRTPSIPFITGDAFRQLCTFRCEDQYVCAFSFSEVQPGDCIYIATTDLRTSKTTTKYLRAYREMLPQIKNPHAVITHNGDLSTPDSDAWHSTEGAQWSAEFSDLLESPALLAWFASNCNWKGNGPKPKKLHCIPIGVENRYNQGGSKPEVYFDWMHSRHSSEPSKMLLAAFRTSANKLLRNEAILSLNASWITKVRHSIEEPGPLSRDNYVRVLQDHHFVACPPGHGFDTHRVWEVLVAGSIPVVVSTPMDSMYEGLPILIVEDWTQVTEQLLQKTLVDFGTRRWNTRKIFFPWWKDLVKNFSLAPVGKRSDLVRTLDIGFQEPCSTIHDYIASARCLLSKARASRVRQRTRSGLLSGIDRSFLLVMMGNKAFVPFVQSWLCNTAHMEGVHERTLLLFTDDGHRALQFNDYGVAYVGSVSANLTHELSEDMSFGTYGYWRLVQLRVHVVASLLRAGIPFLLCEPDALWVQNPLHDRALYSSAEMVYFSDNGQIPGFGFMRLWPTHNIVTLFASLEMEFGRQMPSPLTETSTEIVVTPEQDILYSLLMHQGWLDRIERLRPTKYVSGTWYAQETIHFKTGGQWIEIHGYQVRKDCKAEGMPYVINNNWAVANDVKISRAKRWGHWFLQNESAGTCRNSSMLLQQIASMHSTMQSLAPLHDSSKNERKNCPGLLASVGWSSLSIVAFCILRRCLAIGMSAWAETGVMTSIFLCTLVYRGALDAELGDVHSDLRRRHRLGISLYLSGSDDIEQFKRFLVTMCCVVLVVVGWRLGRIEGKECLCRQTLLIGHLAVKWLAMIILFAAFFLDAEMGDMHSDQRRRQEIGLTMYITIPDSFTYFQGSQYFVCLSLLWICLLTQRRWIYRHLFMQFISSEVRRSRQKVRRDINAC